MGYGFFFQAEDGIRDIGVTGVQTCALPISLRFRKRKVQSFPHSVYPTLEASRMDRARNLSGGTPMIELPDVRFALGEHIDMLRAAVRGFAQAEIAPRATEIDRSNQFPPDLWKKMGALGLLGVTVEDTHGGTMMGYAAHVVAMEEISRASASVGLSYGAHSNLCVNQIRRNGTEAQKR